MGFRDFFYQELTHLPQTVINDCIRATRKIPSVAGQPSQKYQN